MYYEHNGETKMGLFDQISEKLNTAGGSIAQSARDFSESAKYSSQIRESRRIIQLTYEEIGKYCFENRIGESDKRLSDCYQALDNELKKIDKNEERIALLKGAERCPVCGARTPKGSRFCNNCGNLIMQEENLKTQYCPNCGSPLTSTGQKFCETCGAKLEDEGNDQQKNDGDFTDNSFSIEKEKTYLQKMPEIVIPNSPDNDADVSLKIDPQAKEETKDNFSNQKNMETSVPSDNTVVEGEQNQFSSSTEAKDAYLAIDQLYEDNSSEQLSEMKQSEAPDEQNELDNEPDETQIRKEFCPACGNPVEPDARFCEECGRRIR